MIHAIPHMQAVTAEPAHIEVQVPIQAQAPIKAHPRIKATAIIQVDLTAVKAIRITQKAITIITDR